MNPADLVTRRQMLRQSAVGFGYLAAAALLAEEARASDPLAPRPPHFPARAKRVIFLYMVGGPSHVDTFDYKPLLQRDHGRPYPFQQPRVSGGVLGASPWKFHRAGQCGASVSELFPNVARCVDDICFIHSVHGTNPIHRRALLKLHTGSDSSIRPSIGSWITYGLGSENSSLPGFVTICPTLDYGGSDNWGSAFLPGINQGTPLGNAGVHADEGRVAYIRNARFPERVQRLQLDLVGELNRDHQRHSGPERSLEARIESFELAFRMQRTMSEAEDLAGETPATRRLYGLDDPETRSFGRRCLLARRLAERGVRFIQVSHSDSYVQWDQHTALRDEHPKNARQVDLPIAGLLRDLKARGLLEDTLVWWGSEFGRTPTMQGDGRDHNPEGFTMWLAGGGVKAGFRYGATDEYGWCAAENKVHIHDLHATILHLLGLDHERLTYRFSGRDFRLTDVHGQVVRQIIRS